MFLKTISQIALLSLVTFSFLINCSKTSQKKTSLKIMDLSNRSIKEIPAHVFKHQELEFLDISNTRISDIDDRICNFKNLKVLIGKNNYYRDNEIPFSIFCLKNLEVLDMSNSQIKYIDEYIYKLENLRELHLNQNYLSQLPGMLSLLPSLIFIDLRDNKLSLEEINVIQDCTQIEDPDDRESCREDLSDSLYCEDWHKLSFKRGKPLREEYTRVTGLTYEGGKEDKCYNYWIYKYLDYKDPKKRHLLEYTINGKTIREWRVLMTSRDNLMELEMGLAEVPIFSGLWKLFHRSNWCYARRFKIFTGMGVFLPPDQTYLANTPEVYPERYLSNNQKFDKPKECTYPADKKGVL